MVFRRSSFDQISEVDERVCVWTTAYRSSVVNSSISTASLNRIEVSLGVNAPSADSPKYTATAIVHRCDCALLLTWE